MAAREQVPWDSILLGDFHRTVRLCSEESEQLLRSIRVRGWDPQHTSPPLVYRDDLTGG
jgi:hypothetical protein